MMLTVSTDALPEPDRFAYWREELMASFLPVLLEPADTRPFNGRISAVGLGPARVSSVLTTPMNCLRTKRHMNRDEQPYVLVVLQVTGRSTVEQDGREACLSPGDLVLYDTTRPFRTTPVTGDGSLQEQRVLNVPQTLLGLSETDLRRFTATVIRGDYGLGAMFIPFLLALAEEASVCSPSAGARLAGHAADLLFTLLHERIGGPPDTLTPAQQALVDRVEAYINAYLSDPALSPEAIAQAHHISVRYLHKLFQLRQSTVSSFIRQRRLEECRRELRRGMGAFSVAAVAQRWGFASPAHFSRLFRNAYGVPPSNWQQLAS
ncbi:AraC-like ligand-binding domain-containing protein [Streptomyces maremycinicus]|uniref:AraC-like ligand-binding domain-containing protein n=1 Tax=Streptomyces maremycinicus TaxID=1679753 RepID=UPI0007874600|nr:helix-turn-helix domain-containing protein [Streptomyces sp. NBRC 110468]